MFSIEKFIPEYNNAGIPLNFVSTGCLTFWRTDNQTLILRKCAPNAIRSEGSYLAPNCHSLITAGVFTCGVLAIRNNRFLSMQHIYRPSEIKTGIRYLSADFPKPLLDSEINIFLNKTQREFHHKYLLAICFYGILNGLNPLKILGNIHDIRDHDQIKVSF